MMQLKSGIERVRSLLNTIFCRVQFKIVGFLSQNILACRSFSLTFSYVLAGWEGSAADGQIWTSAQETDLRIPDGKYYLGNAGFPSCDALLVPYRSVRYHLREWAQGNQRYTILFILFALLKKICRPQNYKELFNLCHASLRNAIERLFGVIKRKFPLPTRAPKFNSLTQAKLVCATACLFNVIQTYAPQIWDLDVAGLTKLDELNDDTFLA
jgi:hypothetical protein